MALSNKRIHFGGETPHPHEREAIDFLIAGLPDVDPFQLWPLHELADPSTGRLYELDAVILGRHNLYLVEIKSNPGTLTGDDKDWTWTYEGRTTYRENPYPLTNLKAKVLASRLRRELSPETRIYVEPLVFVSHPTVRLDLAATGCPHVVDRATVIRAVTHGEYPGSPLQAAFASRNAGRIVDRVTMREVTKALHALGLRPSRARRLVGDFELRGLISEGPGYQEHLAVHTTTPSQQRRVRSYQVPRATTVAHRDQLRRAAEREADVLARLTGHRGILDCKDFKPDAPLGPALLFEAFAGASSLDTFVRTHPDLAFGDRVHLVQQVAEALEFSHRKDIVHRNLSPRVVLVRRTAQDAPPEVRVHGFHLALRSEGSTPGTRHLTRFIEEGADVYLAPELFDDPTAATPAADIFSLGAIAYFVLTGQPPAPSVLERDRALQAGDGFHITAARDDLAPELDACVAEATRFNPTSRPDTVAAWLNALLDAATRPDAPEPAVVDPYDAAPNDTLPGGYKVEARLGAGTTARVLRVSRAERTFALKIPHDAGCADRLRDEAAVLGRLHHHHIVALEAVLAIGGRDCLLLEFAGDQSLADRLRENGAENLDYARRFGDDLLSAVQHLEEQATPHRDIKPHNVGIVSRGKQALHLVLFDFSLAALPDTAVAAGTPEYRDPWLRLRGRWDAHADRWSAAVTLYEMLTGVRPLRDHAPGIAPARIEPERFDAAVRDRLAAFFDRALADDVATRFPSAEAMKANWLAIFTTAAPVAVTAPPDPAAPDAPPADPYDDVHVSTVVAALPLSSRAKNALDRAAVLTVADLLRLPRNTLSAIRGVGLRVAREIQETAALLRDRLADERLPATAPFVPAYRGRRVALTPGPDFGLDSPAVARLRDAALTTTTAVANAPRDRVLHLLGPATAAALETALRADRFGAGERTVHQWVTDLLAPKKARLGNPERQLRAVLGLLPLPGATDAPPTPHDALREVAQVAAAFGVSRQAVHLHLTHARAAWAQIASFPPLVDAVLESLDHLGGVAPFAAVAADLAQAHGPDDTPDDDTLRAASALVRLVAESRPDGAAPVHLARLPGAPCQALVARSQAHADAARRLGELADDLAARDPLAAAETVRDTLAAAAADTPLAALPPDRLIAVAAHASRHAVPSPRLELYPRTLAPARALQLSTAALAQPEIAPDELRARVHARYPEAAPLPERPDLDALVLALGLVFDPQLDRYRRAGGPPGATTSTIAVPPRLPTAPASARLRQSPEAHEARAFDRALRVGLETGRFRVIQVPADLAPRAAALLADASGAAVVSLDRALTSALDAQGRALGVTPAAVLAADRDGPHGPHWTRLRELARRAAGAVVTALLADRARPQILVHPGLFARYGLAAELDTLVARAEREDGAAVLLLVPSFDEAQGALINQTLAVPTPLPSQRMRMPRSWLENAHRAPEATA